MFHPVFVFNSEENFNNWIKEIRKAKREFHLAQEKLYK